MNIAEYQIEVRRNIDPTNNPRLQLAILSLGLGGEAGECQDLIKKFLGHGKDITLEDLRLELGDLLWYVVAVGDHFGISLQSIIDGNVEKLQARYPEGFRHSEGIISEIKNSPEYIRGTIEEIEGEVIDDYLPSTVVESGEWVPPNLIPPGGFLSMSEEELKPYIDGIIQRSVTSLKPIDILKTSTYTPSTLRIARADPLEILDSHTGDRPVTHEKNPKVNPIKRLGTWIANRFLS